FNEPQNKPTPDGWNVWRNGGPPERNHGTPAVGHQRVLEAIRATGATNVVIADGAQFAQRLDGIPLLHDPLGQVAYGVHPYLTHSLREPDDWEPGFGFLSTQFPVVATEWTAVPGVRFCKPEWETTSPLLVEFLQQRNIGMLAWAFDVLDTLIADGQHTPTSLEGFQCGEEFEHGPGTLIKAQMVEWRASATPCGTGASDEGAVAVPIDVAEGGQYRLWSRVRSLQDGSDSAVSLVQVDDACPVPAWETTGMPPAPAWSWRTGAAAVLNLTPGRHTLRFLGGTGPVNLDRVILAVDNGCIPEDAGNPCPDPPPPTTTTTMRPPPPEPTTTTTHRPRRPSRRPPGPSRRPR
ncbi:MAG TPA: cellulase family glycosylhydrolase, partial [Acidimicrobiia bacterium]|nr:cellulase family glycosylhydrolase [Acidimicrobiia bacterium]